MARTKYVVEGKAVRRVAFTAAEEAERDAEEAAFAARVAPPAKLTVIEEIISDPAQLAQLKAALNAA